MTKILEDDDTTAAATTIKPKNVETTTSIDDGKTLEQVTRRSTPTFYDDYETVNQHKVRKWNIYSVIVSFIGRLGEVSFNLIPFSKVKRDLV